MYEGSMARSRGRNWWGRKKNGREMGPFDCTWIHWLYYQERKQSMSTDERLVDLVWGRWRGFHHAITVVGLFGTILHLLSPILFFFFKQGKCRTEFHAGSDQHCMDRIWQCLIPLYLLFLHWDFSQTNLPASWETCMQFKKQQLELDMEKQTGSKSGKEYIKAVYCHPAYLTYM